ncbi:MAG: ATP-dependent RNA helicase HrpA [Desulfobulbus propionicus]|nr:MAG: ATP-dependent RNA helicase HrpA [Desulfobulbus propionicus]
MHFSYPTALPISAHREEIIAALQEHQILVIAGDTGSGKTTQLPKMCLEAGLGQRGRIGCTQPRRIAAMSVAERVAHETRSTRLVGYTIRFQDRITEETTIKFMTDGILLAETRQDKLLKQYDTLIIDEAHERSLNIDFILGYLKQLLPKRPDLKVIISSATIDTKKLSNHFDNAPIIKVSGRLFPIETRYLEPEELPDEENGTDYVAQAITVVHELTDNPAHHLSGDILIFMPSERDIYETINGFGAQVTDNNLVLPLFGRLQASDQKKIFKPSPKRKIIVATNIAETSITVPEIRFVIDTGLARISRYNVRTGTTSLRIAKVSQASCDQRQGRCGRTGPGICFRLYAEEDYTGREPFTLPEIQRSNLAEVILQMVQLGLGAPEKFPFVDPPQSRAIGKGFQQLMELGALTREKRLTQDGRLMASLPIDPRISRIIIEGNRQKALKEITIIAAALSIQDPRVRPLDKEQKADAAHRQFQDTNSDFMFLLNLWQKLFEDKDKISWSGLSKFCKHNYLSWQRMREWIDVHEQLQRLLRQKHAFFQNTEKASYSAIHKALTSGFLRNICRKKEKNTFQSSGNKEVVLFPGSSISTSSTEWIVAADFVETTQLFARTAANINPEWLEQLGGKLCTYSWTNPRWEKKSGQVIADEHVHLFGLPIVAGRKVNYGRINSETRKEATLLFIQEALLANRLGGNFPFLKANQQLIKQYQEIEERLRRRNIIVEDEELIAFYTQRLNNVYDRFTLKQFIRKHKSDALLRMQKEDICVSAAQLSDLYRYPPELNAGGVNIKLTYTFSPGDERDGVTAFIPLQLAESIQPTVFEWLVPGLLQEKLLFLFKRLPKKLRKSLVPLPDTVDRVLDELELYKGSLYQSIEAILLKTNRLTIQRTDWQPAALPAHLRMRFVFIDAKGKPLLTTRSFHDIHTFQLKDASTPTKKGKKAPTLPQLEDITKEDLHTIQAQISNSSSASTIPVFFSPLFTVDQHSGKIKVSYTQDTLQSKKSIPLGLAALYAREFRTETKQLKKECKALVTNNSASWLALGMKLTAAQLRDAVYHFIMNELFRLQTGAIPTREEFNERVETVRNQHFTRLVAPLYRLLQENLNTRKAAQKRIHLWVQSTKKRKCYSSESHQDFQHTLESILPADFLCNPNGLSLKHTTRYLQALIVRIDRAEHAPEKDKKKKQRLVKPLARLDQYNEFSSPSAQCIEVLNTYRELVEEFRVSVFAPELGTAVSVSEKRLAAFWQEVENKCRMVE